MFDKSELIEELQKKNIPFSIWGRHGKFVVKELETKLNFEFDPEAKLFIEKIGNIIIDGQEILISGDDAGIYSCITETLNEPLINAKNANCVKIMNFAGLSYILYRDGSIKAYDHAYIDTHELIDSYDSLSNLIKSIIKRAVL